MVRKDFKEVVRLIIREIQIKTIMRYHLTPVGIAIIKKPTRNSLAVWLGLHAFTAKGASSTYYQINNKKSTNNNAGEGVEKMVPSYTVGGNVRW